VYHLADNTLGSPLHRRWDRRLRASSRRPSQKTAARHTSAEFAAFLTDIVIDQPRSKENHVVADHQSAHKSRPVTDFLAAHPKVHLQVTPTYSSWLNQVELWFGKIERDVIARVLFAFVSDLKRKLLRYTRQYNKSPRTVKWKYADASRHISPQSVGTGHSCAAIRPAHLDARLC
jgi:transposase